MELQRTPNTSWDWDRTAMSHLSLTSKLYTLSVCAKTAPPDGSYFHSKAEKLEAQRGDLTCSVTQQTTGAPFRFQIWAISQLKAINDLEGGVSRMHIEGFKPSFHRLSFPLPPPSPSRVLSPRLGPLCCTSSPCHLSPGRDLWISLQGFFFNNNIYNHFRN